MYFIGGFLYKRFVLGAKGLEQIPNYKFWEDFGNLQAVSIYLDLFHWKFINEQAFRFMVGPSHCPMISKYGSSLFKAVGSVDPSF